MNRLTETIAIAIVAVAVAYFAAHIAVAGGRWVTQDTQPLDPRPACAHFEDGSFLCVYPDGTNFGGCNPGAICND